MLPSRHWGYCDLDMGVGNLQLFVERAELTDNEIVSIFNTLTCECRHAPRLTKKMLPSRHWGYCDLDMVVGNLPLFVERAELIDNNMFAFYL